MMTIQERNIEDAEPSKVTVVVPVKNEAKKLGQCLEALSAQSHEPAEIIVVDGHSTDGTVEIAKKFPVKVLYEDIGTRAGANQVAIEQAMGDYVAFTDADCIPDKDWLRNLLQGFGEDVVGVGGVIINIGENPWEESINAAMDSFLGSAQSVQGRVYKTKKRVGSISGCNSIYKKRALTRVGGFDIGLPTAEDTELNRRLRGIGDLVFTPDAIIVHNHTRGLKEFAKRTYQYGYGKGKCLITDLQLIPPVAAAVVLFLPLVSIWAFMLMMFLYLVILFVSTLRVCWKSKRFGYFHYIITVYVAEHIAYTVGLWKGLFSYALNRLRQSKKTATSTQTS